MRFKWYKTQAILSNTEVNELLIQLQKYVTIFWVETHEEGPVSYRCFRIHYYYHKELIKGGNTFIFIKDVKTVKK